MAGVGKISLPAECLTLTPLPLQTQIYLVMGVLTALQLGMGLFFPNAIHGYSEMEASCRRLEVRGPA